MNDIQSICVYSSSSPLINENYVMTAKELGKLFAEHQIELIYGAGKVGLMGTMADAVLERGGKVTGVIPTFMIERDWHHNRLTTLLEVDTMHERKQKMASLSDGVVALPGGCGTLEELLEIITWKQLGLYANPIVIVNTNGFYNPLIEMLNKAIDEKFMRSNHRDLWQVANKVTEVMDLLTTTPLWNSSTDKFGKE